MNLQFTPDGLLTLRRTVTDHAVYMATFPAPEAGGYSFESARKCVRKINAALKKHHGHDCSGDWFLDRIAPLPGIPRGKAGGE